MPVDPACPRHSTSAAFAATKFQDLARLDGAPTHFAITHRTSFDERLAIIAQAVQVCV